MVRHLCAQRGEENWNSEEELNDVYRRRLRREGRGDGWSVEEGHGFWQESVTTQASGTRETMFIRSEAADDGKEDVGICTWLDDVLVIAFTSFRGRVQYSY